ncbi:MAG: oxidoreductase [Halieaceae bacterium]|jgi:NAD(P)-dependent dehydrogenase (short-subunit alcohol dehydrogenase family)|nr:oxidoreductase [Halieaceae bacterium]
MPSPQQPVASPFGERSTAMDVAADADLADRHVIVTGGYSGIGTETVRALAARGAQVIVGARRPDQAREVLAALDGAIEVVALDLLSPASIDAFAAEITKRIAALPLLINNAAVMACPLTRDERGYEFQFATNHLGHFQLTARLWPLLVAAEEARVVVLSSIGHRLNGLDVDDPNFEARDYDKWLAYGQAKSANALFALHLDSLGEAQGVRAFSVHPGGIRTPLQRHLSMEEQTAMGWYDEEGNLNPAFKSVEEGAATTVWCATSPLLAGMGGVGGVYCEDCNVALPADQARNRTSGVSAHVCDEALAEALWRRSEALCDLRFPAA